MVRAHTLKKTARTTAQICLRSTVEPHTKIYNRRLIVRADLYAEKTSGIKPVRILVLLLVIIADPILTRLIENIPITVTQLAYFLLNGAILAFFSLGSIPRSASADGHWPCWSGRNC